MAAAGPRRAVDPSQVLAPATPAALADVEAFVARREGGHADLRPGAAARVTWADPQAPGRTALAVIYLHGFSATRQETAPLAARLAAALGANLFEARLRGHGRSQDALGEATAEQWLEDAAQALAIGRLLGERVVVVGCSTGATLAAWLAGDGRAPGVGALILISPNFAIGHPAASLLSGPWGSALAHAIEGPYRSFRPVNAAHAAAWTTRYPTRAAVEVAALVAFVRASDLGAVSAPTLVVYSRRDAVVDPAATEACFARLGAPAKRLVAFEEAEDPAHHVLAGEILSPTATAALLTLCREFLAAQGAGSSPAGSPGRATSAAPGGLEGERGAGRE